MTKDDATFNRHAYTDELLVRLDTLGFTIADVSRAMGLDPNERNDLYRWTTSNRDNRVVPNDENKHKIERALAYLIANPPTR